MDMQKSTRLDRAKKEAKRLFGIAEQQGGKLEITALSAAQKIIAAIRGFPSWHDLERQKEEMHERPNLSFVGLTKEQMDVINAVKKGDDNKFRECFGLLDDPFFKHGLLARTAAAYKRHNMLQAALPYKNEYHIYASALSNSAKVGDDDGIKILLERGADPTAFFSDALEAAAANGHAECVKILLDAGANPKDGDSAALRNAIMNGHEECVAILKPISDLPFPGAFKSDEGCLSNQLGTAILGTRKLNPKDFALCAYEDGCEIYVPILGLSPIRTTSVTLIHAAPGYGKSMLLAESISNVRRDNLRLAVISIDDSLEGACQSFSENNEMVKISLGGNSRIIINPLDTALGRRLPDDRELEDMVGLIASIIPNTKKECFFIIKDALRKTFEQFSDFSDSTEPTSYMVGHRPDVDEAFSPHDMPSTWWEAVDRLAASGRESDLKKAKRAQEMAMPTIRDVAVTMKNTPLRGFEKEGGELSVELEKQNSVYPSLFRQTEFCLKTEQAVSALLIVVDVSKLRGEAPFFILATKIAKTFLHHYELFDSFTEYPERIKKTWMPIWRRLHKNISNRNSGIIVDEFHRFNDQGDNAFNIALRDIRESRKMGVSYILSTQMMQPEQKRLVGEFATTIIEAGFTGGEAVLQTKSAEGCTRDGATFAIGVSSRYGYTEGEAIFKFSPDRLWYNATSIEDRKLLDRLSKKMSRQQAAFKLATKFPVGTCRYEMELRLAEERDNPKQTFSKFLDSMEKELCGG